MLIIVSQYREDFQDHLLDVILLYLNKLIH